MGEMLEARELEDGLYFLLFCQLPVKEPETFLAL